MTFDPATQFVGVMIALILFGLNYFLGSFDVGDLNEEED
tara:strand:+ start:288 stop:404 length:117 start_codon:yes stop_codon:yes gene_type:complete